MIIALNLRAIKFKKNHYFKNIFNNLLEYIFLITIYLYYLILHLHKKNYLLFSRFNSSSTSIYLIIL